MITARKVGLGAFNLFEDGFYVGHVDIAMKATKDDAVKTWKMMMEVSERCRKEASDE